MLVLLRQVHLERVVLRSLLYPRLGSGTEFQEELLQQRVCIDIDILLETPSEC